MIGERLKSFCKAIARPVLSEIKTDYGPDSHSLYHSQPSLVLYEGSELVTVGKLCQNDGFEKFAHKVQ